MKAGVFLVTVIADLAMNPSYTRVNGINDLSNKGEYVNNFWGLEDVELADGRYLYVFLIE